jgi:hypothetical protein
VLFRQDSCGRVIKHASFRQQILCPQPGLSDNAYFSEGYKIYRTNQRMDI